MITKCLLLALFASTWVGAAGAPPDPAIPAVRPADVGIAFISGSTSSFTLEKGGKTYIVDLKAQTVHEAPTPESGSVGAGANALPSHSSRQPDAAAIFESHCASCHGYGGQGVASHHTPDFSDQKVQAGLTDEALVAAIRDGVSGSAMPAWKGKLSEQEILSVAAYLRSFEGAASGSSGAAQATNVYQPGDDLLMSLPTGRQLNKHGLVVNFTHRFAYAPALSGTARGGALFGLDGFSLSSFGFRYGVSKKLSVSIYRSPTFIARPIQMMAAYSVLSEFDGAPLNVTARFSLEGQNDFDRNFAENFELILSKSLTHRAQLYFVPTFTLNARRLFSPTSYASSAIPDLPHYNTFSTGVGAAFDIRPTVALVAEVMPTLVNGDALGIHRPAYSFGIQKKIWRHAFTIGLTNSPGTTVSQRAGTVAAFFNQPEADKPKGLFLGFDLSRQVH